MATYKPLQSVVLTAATSSITFSGIDQSYTDLVIVGNAATSVAGAQNVLRFNGSTGTYSTTDLYGTGSSISGYRFSGQTYMWFSSGVGIGSTIGQSAFTININNYSNSTTYKTAIMRLSSNSGTYPGVVLSSGLWSNTSPITSVTLYADTGSTTWSAGSTFSLYGIKSGAPQAIGGDLVTTDGNYWYHTFRSTQTFTPLKTLSVDYLVVAGGGGGGWGHGGGGGAGGLRSTVTATGGGGSLESATSVFGGVNYTVIVGSGGAAATSTSVQATSGSNSVFSSITSTGGGGGGSRLNGTGLTGGSGGGGSFYSIGGTGTTNQGFGGGGTLNTSNPGSGGGGAGSVGATSGGSAGVGGNGGAGVSTSISGSSVGYAGGGGGGANGSTNGSATSGGGGGGTTTGTAGTANTGGGGGGGAFAVDTQYAGAAGGSGIVIVRYAV
jgi:hypothetical protein